MKAAPPSLHTILARTMLVLDKPRELRFSFGVLAEWQEQFGKTGGDIVPSSLEELALLIHLLCKNEDPAITIEAIRPHVNFRILSVLRTALFDMAAQAEKYFAASQLAHPTRQHGLN